MWFSIETTLGPTFSFTQPESVSAAFSACSRVSHALSETNDSGPVRTTVYRLRPGCSRILGSSSARAFAIVSSRVPGLTL